jgi:hypothetical protein
MDITTPCWGSNGFMLFHYSPHVVSNGNYSPIGSLLKLIVMSRTVESWSAAEFPWRE